MASFSTGELVVRMEYPQEFHTPGSLTGLGILSGLFCLPYFLDNWDLLKFMTRLEYVSSWKKKLYQSVLLNLICKDPSGSSKPAVCPYDAPPLLPLGGKTCYQTGKVISGSAEMKTSKVTCLSADSLRSWMYVYSLLILRVFSCCSQALR